MGKDLGVVLNQWFSTGVPQEMSDICDYDVENNNLYN